MTAVGSCRRSSMISTSFGFRWASRTKRFVSIEPLSRWWRSGRSISPYRIVDCYWSLCSHRCSDAAQGDAQERRKQSTMGMVGSADHSEPSSTCSRREQFGQMLRGMVEAVQPENEEEKTEIATAEKHAAAMRMRSARMGKTSEQRKSGRSHDLRPCESLGMGFVYGAFTASPPGGHGPEARNTYVSNSIGRSRSFQVNQSTRWGGLLIDPSQSGLYGSVAGCERTVRVGSR